MIDILLVSRQSCGLLLMHYPQHKEILTPVMTALEAAIAKLVIIEVRDEN